MYRWTENSSLLQSRRSLVSTPPVRLAYSLAAGGPIVVPGVDAIIITPVSPHASQSPLVVRGDSEIEMVVKNTQEGPSDCRRQTGVEIQVAIASSQ